MKRFFDIHNAVFCNGVLTGYCVLSFFKSTRLRCENLEAFCAAELPGLESDPRFRIERPKAHIVIGGGGSANGRKSTIVPTRFKDYQNSLIHEMLHAVFFIYVCRCDHGCVQEFNEDLRVWSGHSEPWLAGAYAIEQQTRSSLTRSVASLESWSKRYASAWVRKLP